MTEDSNTGPDAPEDAPSQQPSSAQGAKSGAPGVLINGPEYGHTGPVLIDKWVDLTFRIPQRDGLDHQTIIWFVTSGGSVKLIDRYFRDYDWHTVYLGELAEGYPGRFHAQWNYKGKWSDMTYLDAVVRRAAAFDPVNVVSEWVHGTARQGSVIKLVVPNSADSALSEAATAGANGRWSARLLPSVTQGRRTFLIREDLPGTTGRYTQTTVFTVIKPVTVTDIGVTTLQRPRIEGTGGLPDATVDAVIQNTLIKVLANATVESNGAWGGTSIYDFAPGQSHVLGIRQTYGDGTSGATISNFYVLGPPCIESPTSLQIVDTTSLFKGAVRIADDSSVVIRSENTSAQIQTPVNSSSGEWSTSFTLTPGPHSIVCWQIYKGQPSVSNIPFGIRVRPDKPTGTHTQHGDTITFSGTGHYDPKLITQVQFSVTAGGGDAPPTVTIPATGKWESSVAGWDFGSYTVEVIQKIGDGANGWIESHPFRFTVNHLLPDVSDVKYTRDYQPTFSGKGYNGATVQPRKPNSADLEAPAVVVASGQWSSKALAVWGPVFEREVHIKQVLDEHESPNWVVLKVTIPPLAPGLEPPVEEGLSPFFKGTCWPGATVNITFSDDPTSYAATVQGELWTFRRSTDFDPGVHTVSVTQYFAQQTSVAVDATFTVQIPMLKPRITAPAAGDEVGSDVEICGNNGMQFATMQLYNALFDRAVGNPLHLENSGEWRITLSDLEFGQFTVYAVQTLDSRDSERSENHALKVVLLPPRITTPEAGGKLAREAALEGTGRAGGWVDVWLDGDDEPWQRNITVGWNSLWRREVELPVGSHTLRVRQSFDDNGTVHESACTDWMSFDVVPAAPFIETPVEGEAIGRQAVVSGFGVPGDTVTVTLAEGARSVLASTIVREDRTWSVMCDCAAVAGGRYQLQAVASLDTFESVEARRAVVLGIFLPILDEPAPGSWVVHPLQFAGRGRQGIGTLVSWYNPEVFWAPELAIVDGQWRGESIRALPEGGNWYRFRQTITDGAAGETISAWVDSARFEVERTRAPGRYHSDGRS
ncbi:hypothetical protein HU765_15375 [Pseudomonas sp. SWRI81]|uniref:hypothetical protein n=1 Tax=Pseudomonas sp. SWRI81 TaxID=2745505 RepID=UPI001648330F|nr:hypothetical protein [Pseudomonas sp. SWRI81]MBC3271324.1 hypothetical protein [Pseudomonas sp. SWRI81]